LPSLLTAFKLPRDQALVPPQQRLGRYESGDGFEALAPQRVSQGRQAAAIRVGQPQPAAPELSLEDAVLLEEVGDDVLLVPLQPASQPPW
jgi:hypothetical protein